MSFSDFFGLSFLGKLLRACLAATLAFSQFSFALVLAELALEYKDETDDNREPIEDPRPESNVEMLVEDPNCFI